MEEKNPYQFQDPLAKKTRPSHSIAGLRHRAHSLRTKNQDLAVLTQQPEPNAPVVPAAPPPTPVDEILPTALPADQSIAAAQVVAQSAFQSHYAPPQPPVVPSVTPYAVPPVAAVQQFDEVVPESDYDLSGSGDGSGGSSTGGVLKAVAIIMAAFFLPIIIAVIYLLISS